MGIKKSLVFVSDRGQEFELDEMETSHILNTLNLYRQKLKTIEFFQQNESNGTGIKQEAIGMMSHEFTEACDMLCNELNRRAREEGSDMFKQRDEL